MKQNDFNYHKFSEFCNGTFPEWKTFLQAGHRETRTSIPIKISEDIGNCHIPIDMGACEIVDDNETRTRIPIKFNNITED